MVRRQDFIIAKTLHSFFINTETYRGIEVDVIAKHVSEYRSLWLTNPITENVYGANFTAGLNLFLMTRCLAPQIIVESGVYKGVTSYFLASASPNAKVHSFDPDLSNVHHRILNVTYKAHDWMASKITCDPVGSGLCFFDDHQNQALRVIQAYERGFRHLIFDDSWPMEVVVGCGWPPLPSIDMVMSNSLLPGQAVRWIEFGSKVWTYVHTEEMQALCARARRVIKAAYEVPSLYRECGIAPTSAYKFVELTP